MKSNKTTIASFGFTSENEVKNIILENDFLRVEILNFGCTIHAILLKELNHDVVVGPKTLEGYIKQFEDNAYYFGATIGRHAGRISNGGFSLDDKRYDLNHANKVHLHGGKNGLHQKIWSIEKVETVPYPKVILSYESKDMEEGYPGNLKVTATISLTTNNAIELVYEAVGDKDTILNLTNHTYFNLGSDSITNHNLNLASDTILDCDENLIPSGKKLNIHQTAYDFTKASSLQKIEKNNGLDNVFCFEKNANNACKVIYFAPSTGLEMRISSNQNCAVVFAPEKLVFNKESKNEIYTSLPYPAICFEMQNYPDAPNHANFPSSTLKKGERYLNSIVYKFNIKK